MVDAEATGELNVVEHVLFNYQGGYIFFSHVFALVAMFVMAL